MAVSQQNMCAPEVAQPRLAIKPLCLAATAFFLFSSTVQAKENPYKTEFFEAAKTYANKDVTLNDVIEFTIFDMSEVKFINESDENTLKKTRDRLVKLPKIFYQNLKNQILTERVPVTLYPANAPEYTKPLTLSIKIKSLHLKSIASAEENTPTQSVSMRIFGQIQDKKTGDTWIKFYDSNSDVFLAQTEDADVIYDKISGKIMKNLALFLKSKY